MGVFSWGSGVRVLTRLSVQLFQPHLWSRLASVSPPSGLESLSKVSLTYNVYAMMPVNPENIIYSIFLIVYYISYPGNKKRYSSNDLKKRKSQPHTWKAFQTLITSLQIESLWSRPIRFQRNRHDTLSVLSLKEAGWCA